MALRLLARLTDVIDGRERDPQGLNYRCAELLSILTDPPLFSSSRLSFILSPPDWARSRCNRLLFCLPLGSGSGSIQSISHGLLRFGKSGRLRKNTHVCYYSAQLVVLSYIRVLCRQQHDVFLRGNCCLVLIKVQGYLQCIMFFGRNTKKNKKKNTLKNNVEKYARAKIVSLT